MEASNKVCGMDENLGMKESLPVEIVQAIWNVNKGSSNKAVEGKMGQII